MEILESNLVCFYTRRSFKDEVLGVGVKLKRNRRTLNILAILPNFDLISLKAFMRFGVRKSATNVSFDHWLPIYINKEHGLKSMNLSKRAISIMVTGHVGNFDPLQVLHIYPAVISSTIVQLSTENLSASSKVIEFLYQIERIFIEFAIQYPQIVEGIKFF